MRMKEILFSVLFLIVCAIGTYSIRFCKPPRNQENEGFTDVIGEGESIYKGYTDKWRPDLYARPSHGFWGNRYTPIWLIRKR